MTVVELSTTLNTFMAVIGVIVAGLSVRLATIRPDGDTDGMDVEGFLSRTEILLVGDLIMLWGFLTYLTSVIVGIPILTDVTEIVAIFYTVIMAYVLARWTGGSR